MQAINNLVLGVANVFPNHTLHYNVAKESRIIGGKFITYDFAFAPGYANILHNAKGLIRLMIQDKDPSGKKDINDTDPVEVEAILYEYRFSKVGIKFRKINAKNLDEAVRKIIKWFEKNSEGMIAVFNEMKD